MATIEEAMSGVVKGPAAPVPAPAALPVPAAPTVESSSHLVVQKEVLGGTQITISPAHNSPTQLVLPASVYQQPTTQVQPTTHSTPNSQFNNRNIMGHPKMMQMMHRMKHGQMHQERETQEQRPQKESDSFASGKAVSDPHNLGMNPGVETKAVKMATMMRKFANMLDASGGTKTATDGAPTTSKSVTNAKDQQQVDNNSQSKSNVQSWTVSGEKSAKKLVNAVPYVKQSVENQADLFDLESKKKGENEKSSLLQVEFGSKLVNAVPYVK
jgi:hypothetical protein